MQVKRIHFIETIPGQPVYEMEDNDIRIPFPTGNAILWLNYDEAAKAIVDKSDANMKILRDQFYGIKQQIGGKKVHTITIKKPNC